MSTLLDARVVRTRQALRQAMTELAEDRPLEAITVRAIAARAGVGYATFFRHYADKEALLADVADLLTHGGSGETVRAEMLRQCLATVAETRTHKPTGPLDDLIVLHLVSSVLYVVAWWLRNLEAVEVESMAEIIERLVLAPVGGLRADPPKGL
jgi:AcrR family transcriptional regulator